MHRVSKAGLFLRFAVLSLLIAGVGLTCAVAGAAQKDGPAMPAASVPYDLTKPDMTPAEYEYYKNFHEDLTTLTLDKSNLKAGTPILGEIDDVPDSSFIRERYQVIWRPGDPMDLYVIRPRGVKKPPVVMYLYSYPQDTDRFKSDGWCTGITSSGVAAIGFVSALTGHRLLHHALKDDFVEKLQEGLGSTTHDVQMIVNYIETRDDLDSKHIGMFGQGSGGAVAILASAADPRIKAIDVLTPWGDWPDWVAKTAIIGKDERASFMAPEFLAGVAPLEPTKWFSKVKAQSVRLRDIRNDPLVDTIVQEKIEKAVPGRAEVEEYGDGNAFMPKSVGPQMFMWLWTQLKPDAVQSAEDNTGPHIHVFPARGKSIDAPAN